jgi:hypothetical protein
VATHSKDWDRLLAFAQFTYNAAYDKSLHCAPFRAYNRFLWRMGIVLLVHIPSADWVLKIAPEAHKVVDRMMPDLRVLTERLKEAQTMKIVEANKCHHKYDLEVGKSKSLKVSIAFLWAVSHHTSHR